MINYENVDEKIMLGYEHLVNGESIETCNVWLEAWEGIKEIITENNLKNIEELQKKYKWTEFLTNYIQDLEAELHNAGVEDKEYFQKRIQYCEEMLSLYGSTDGLLIENTHRAIADSHYELGEKEKCDQLYRTWLEEDPSWGWGYIGWSDCYQFDKAKNIENLEKSEQILRKALDRKDLRDRIDVVERAIDVYEALGKDQELEELKKEFELLKTRTRTKRLETSIPARSEKVGRNNPCPCGSGKKYKKCCGK